VSISQPELEKKQIVYPDNIALLHPSANTADKQYVIGEDVATDLNVLLDKCRRNIPDCDENQIRLAFRYCVLAHDGKLRKSGKKYYTHPLSTAFIVIDEIPLDNTSVIAALLHNVLDESNLYSYEDIRFAFGADVSHIIENVSRIKFIESQHIEGQDQIDNYRKLLISLFTDIRIILIKLADRLDNMRTLQYISTESQRKISQETLDVYVPFANRFGLTRIKFELEDTAFKYLQPEVYKQIEDTIKGTHEERTKYVERFQMPVSELLSAEALLEKEDVHYRINGRAKNIYSIYNKTLLRKKSVEELYDIFAIRIILDTNNPLLCFYVYGIVASLYPPIPETFKDYISSPKPNGYRSLHTAVFGPDNRAVEVQIRTEQMHQAAEVGVAAHFRYKSGTDDESIMENDSIQNWLDDVRTIFNKAGDTDVATMQEFLTKNVMHGIVYVFTPKNEFRKFPRGATALDFAFDIHTEVGLHCISAKINDAVQPINYVLNSGDKVEIVTSNTQQPSKEWLNFVITAKAKAKLLDYFKEQRSIAISKGKEAWKRKNENYGYKFSNRGMRRLLQELQFRDEHDFYEALGNATIDIDAIYTSIMKKVSDQIIADINEHYENGEHRQQNKFQTLEDYSQYDFEFGKCCKPLPKEVIFGELVGEHSVIVHTSNCPHCKNLIATNIQNVAMLAWKNFGNIKLPVTLQIVADDRKHLIRDIAKTIASDDMNQLTHITYDVDAATFSGTFQFNISIHSDIAEIVNGISILPNIKQCNVV
jgi:GTP pyrophosphokinase/guanosine-3',5'-bis(diphosphate) 3'-pyrophosphohydrolase